MSTNHPRSLPSEIITDLKALSSIIGLFGVWSSFFTSIKSSCYILTRETLQHFKEGNQLAAVSLFAMLMMLKGRLTDANEC